jgi:mono/diheme cytochrome c family protein
MKRTLPVLLILLTIGARPGTTQKTGAGLTDQQKLGRQVLMQSCAVCHLPSGPDAKTYGPSLNKSTLPEDDVTARQTILEGTGRMPGFQYFLQPAQVDAIIAYIRTVPPRARPATATQKKSNVDD